MRVNKTKSYIFRSCLGIFGGISLGYIFALDVTGWYFLKPHLLLLFEILGALLLLRISHGLLQDNKISAPVKRGFIWAVFGLVAAHVINLGYLYLKDLQASFSIEKIDFAETLAISWAYMHFTMIGYISGAIYEYIITHNRNKRLRIQMEDQRFAEEAFLAEYHKSLEQNKEKVEANVD